MSPHFVIVGNPGCNRVAAFQAALQRCAHPPADVITWADLLTGRTSLADVTQGGSIVRLESPGRDFAVERLLLAEGADAPEDEDLSPWTVTRDAALSLEFELGRVWCPRQWYRGFRSALRRLHADRWMNHPADIATAFDKRVCQRMFADAGIPVPAIISPVRDFDELLQRMRDADHRQVFVKLTHGSSASGVVALTVAGSRMRAQTTVEMVYVGGQLRMYNSRRPQIYDRPADVATIINALAAEGVQAEEWLPKAAIDGKNFDLRVVVIAGRTRHVVPRLSAGPMTNLHLLNQRGDAEAVRALVPADAWDAAMRDCERAAACLPGLHYAGVDVAFAPGYGRHAVLEINAFGDLLNGVTWRGRDTFAAELEALRP